MRLFNVIWRRFRRNKLALLSAVIIIFLIIISLSAPLIAPYDPADIDISNVLSPPSGAHPLGTDDLGRDLLSRMIWGSRISLSVGFAAVGISIITGIIVGAIAGYYGGWIDTVLMRFVDIMLTFPTLFLILAVIAIMGPGIFLIMLIIGLTGWMDVARLVRAEFLTLKERDFVWAARSIGVKDAGIIFRHILPNALAPVFVAATMG
ncbi:MAG: ABC transporter permease, partial [Nitrospirae bacterium]|nr:ABC transporter permease [Nitrospirota bacterium]